MRNPFKKNAKTETEDFSHLLQLINEDPQIKYHVVQVLTLDSYQRRLVLNRWLEELRRKCASQNLRQALAYLFDDHIAEKVLILINNRSDHITNSRHCIFRSS